MLRAISSSIARAVGETTLQRSAAAALPAQGGRAGAQHCQKFLLDSSCQDRQSSSSDDGQAPWYQVRWQLGVTAAATAGFIGRGRCADEDEEEIQVTYLSLSFSCEVHTCLQILMACWHIQASK